MAWHGILLVFVTQSMTRHPCLCAVRFWNSYHQSYQCHRCQFSISVHSQGFRRWHQGHCRWIGRSCTCFAAPPPPPLPLVRWCDASMNQQGPADNCSVWFTNSEGVWRTEYNSWLRQSTLIEPLANREMVLFLLHRIPFPTPVACHLINWFWACRW